MSDTLLGREIRPYTPQPAIGSSQQNTIFQALMGALGVGQNGEGFGQINPLASWQGPTSPNVDSTRLSEVYRSWQPWDSGMGYLSQAMHNQGPGALNIGRYSPISENMMQWGGTGGVGNNFMKTMAQFGAPSEAGQYTGNMAQFGVSAEGAGRPLANLAYGQGGEAAKYLAPYLMAQASPYRAPSVPARSVTVSRP